MKVFIQIASYRDRELIPTIKDLLARARHPDRLRFGICRQYHPKDGFDNLDGCKKDPRFRVLDVLYDRASGVGFARNLTQRLYMGEQFTMQIDSHMRFIKDWDVKMTQMIFSLQDQGYKKPMLTGYMGSYTPGKENAINYTEPPLQMEINNFDEEGIPAFTSTVIPFFDQLVCPVPARFFSAGFYFTLGQFCREVPYDPNIYFLGEEISIAARAYTHGYDLFHAHKMLLWHYHYRKGNPKHWDDDQVWYLKNMRSYSRLKSLLKIDGHHNAENFGQYGFGSQRSLEAYKKYAGVVFPKIA